MYNENFGQFIQSFAGVVRSISELRHDNPNYEDEDFGVVLICDGIEKIKDDFIDCLIKHKLFNPEQ
jgi:hypothetical protein